MKRKRRHYGRKPWTDDEVAILEKHYPSKGLAWCSRKLKRSKNSVKSKVQLIGGLSFGLTKSVMSGKHMTLRDIAVAADVPHNTVKSAMYRDSSLKIRRYGSKLSASQGGKIVYVDRAWAQAFIDQQVELRENAKNYSHWWDAKRAADFLKIGTTTLCEWANGNKTSLDEMMIDCRCVRIKGKSMPKWVFDPEGLTAARRVFDEHAEIAKKWVSIKVLQVECNISAKRARGVVHSLGTPKSLFYKSAWRLYVSPEDAQTIRDYYGIRKAA